MIRSLLLLGTVVLTVSGCFLSNGPEVVESQVPNTGSSARSSDAAPIMSCNMTDPGAQIDSSAQVTLTGELILEYIEFLDTETNRFLSQEAFYLKTENPTAYVELEFTSESRNQRALVNQQVTVAGSYDALLRLQVTAINSQSLQLRSRNPTITLDGQPRRIAFVFIRPENKDVNVYGPLIWPKKAFPLVEDTARSFAETTGGEITLDYKDSRGNFFAFGPMPVARNADGFECNPTNRLNWANDGIAAVIADLEQQIAEETDPAEKAFLEGKLTKFKEVEHYVIIPPAASPCGMSGIAQMGSGRRNQGGLVWMTLPARKAHSWARTLAHEIGHNLGFGHSAVAGQINYAYADGNCVMGGAPESGRMFNAQKMRKSGVLAKKQPSAIASHPEASDRFYDIIPLYAGYDRPGVRVIEIPETGHVVSRNGWTAESERLWIHADLTFGKRARTSGEDSVQLASFRPPFSYSLSTTTQILVDASWRVQVISGTDTCFSDEPPVVALIDPVTGDSISNGGAIDGQKLAMAPGYEVEVTSKMQNCAPVTLQLRGTWQAAGQDDVPLDELQQQLTLANGEKGALRLISDRDYRNNDILRLTLTHDTAGGMLVPETALSFRIANATDRMPVAEPSNRNSVDQTDMADNNPTPDNKPAEPSDPNSTDVVVNPDPQDTMPGKPTPGDQPEQDNTISMDPTDPADTIDDEMIDDEMIDDEMIDDDASEMIVDEKISSDGAPSEQETKGRLEQWLDSGFAEKVPAVCVTK